MRLRNTCTLVAVLFLLSAPELRAQTPGNAASHKPNFSPSYDVHITPGTENGTFSASGDDYWSVRGFSLKRLIAETYGMGMEPGRIDFPDAAAAEKRYDVA